MPAASTVRSLNSLMAATPSGPGGVTPASPTAAVVVAPERGDDAEPPGMTRHAIRPRTMVAAVAATVTASRCRLRGRTAGGGVTGAAASAPPGRNPPGRKAPGLTTPSGTEPGDGPARVDRSEADVGTAAGIEAVVESDRGVEAGVGSGSGVGRDVGPARSRPARSRPAGGDGCSTRSSTTRTVTPQPCSHRGPNAAPAATASSRARSRPVGWRAAGSLASARATTSPRAGGTAGSGGGSTSRCQRNSSDTGRPRGNIDSPRSSSWSTTPSP